MAGNYGASGASLGEIADRVRGNRRAKRKQAQAGRAAKGGRLRSHMAASRKAGQSSADAWKSARDAGLVNKRMYDRMTGTSRRVKPVL